MQADIVEWHAHRLLLGRALAWGSASSIDTGPDRVDVGIRPSPARQAISGLLVNREWEDLQWDRDVGDDAR